MGLFSKKKKELPRFPKLPERPSFPEYMPQVPTPDSFKKPVEKRLEIPELQPEEFTIPMRRPEMPRPMPIPELMQPRAPSGPQPIFVKIDKYKAAINALNEIKQKLTEAEETLTKLNAIKLRESDEIKRWEIEIQNIKDKLMVIDKNLFEV